MNGGGYPLLDFDDGYVITRTSIVRSPRRTVRRVSTRGSAGRFMPASSAPPLPVLKATTGIEPVCKALQASA